MRTLVQRLKRLWNTPVEFYGVDRPEIQAGPWHGLLLFVVLLVILGLLWLIRYLPERTYLVQLPSMSPQGRTAAGESCQCISAKVFKTGVNKIMTRFVGACPCHSHPAYASDAVLRKEAAVRRYAPRVIRSMGAQQSAWFSGEARDVLAPLQLPFTTSGLPLERHHDTSGRSLAIAIGVRDGTYDAFSTTTTSTCSVLCSSNLTRLAAASERSMMRRFPAP
jgi:hypothetical protein